MVIPTGLIVHNGHGLSRGFLITGHKNTAEGVVVQQHGPLWLEVSLPPQPVEQAQLPSVGSFSLPHNARKIKRFRGVTCQAHSHVPAGDAAAARRFGSVWNWPTGTAATAAGDGEGTGKRIGRA